MSRFIDMLKALVSSRKARWIGAPLVVASTAASLISFSQSVTPLPVAVNLSAEPLYARGARAKPTLTLALSVEFPTVGAQYVSSPGATSDNSYSPSNEYIGYFDASSCYTYNNGATAIDRYFIRSGAATGRSCGGNGFSGNFMNWATSSAIDILRYGLTGGDRVVDRSDLTVLQRAVLPNTGVSNNFWNGSNFPSKRLSSTLVAGALPTNLTSGYTGDVYVANCLNQVHFGTQATGSCASPGANSNLGVGTAAALPTTGIYSGTLPTGFSSFANEAYPTIGAAYTVSGTEQIAYGSGSTWAIITQTGGSVYCSNLGWATYGVPGLAVSGDPTPGVGKQCYRRTPPPLATSTALTSDTFFYSRVRVCESTSAGVLTDPRNGLCLRYPNGNYKPIGNLQRYADNIRVAAFGYLNDGTLDRYGGVLRAPMKYVGPRSYDANFALSQTSNPVEEWDASTGVFKPDPDSSIRPTGTPISTSINRDLTTNHLSGVVNYLNQFGRTGVFGQYKTYDPVGEMYYESLRYLQGLPPTSGTSSATSPTYGITDAMRDGFPVYDTWLSSTVPDPHPAVAGMTDYSCIKNNIVAIGDVNTHADKYIPGNTRVSSGDVARAANASSNEPNFYEWTRVVGAFEEARSYGYTDASGASRSTSNFNTANLFNPDIEDASPGTCCNNNSFYIAGVAYWANMHDIRGTGWTSNTAAQRPGMRVKTYILDVNEYGNQSDRTTRRRNQFYLAGKYGGFDDDPTLGRPGIGNPFVDLAPASSPTTYVNSNSSWERVSNDVEKREAKSYFLSSSAAEVLASLDQIFEDINRQARSIAGVAISTQRLTTNTGYVYQAQFDPASWSGDLQPTAVTASGATVAVGDASSSPWRNAANDPVGAAGKLDDRNLGTNPRNIVVGYHTSLVSPSFNSESFVWTGLDAGVRQALRNPGYPASAAFETDDVNAQRRLSFLRGDRLQEAPTGIFRRRASRLGDIVNSGVVYSGAPTQNVPGADYEAFRTDTAIANRPKTLFVGANDGMLHAFNADTGDELFGYIPSWLVPKLSALTHPSYIHQSYQDATPAVAEVRLDRSGATCPALTSSRWCTMLVSGSGGGGQGVFALDVSNPAAFNSNSAMWEFTDRDDPAMGNVIGRPQILMLNVGSPTVPAYRYFAVVASGVNNYVADGNASTGEPALFFLRMDKEKSAAWVEGTNPDTANYFKITFPRTSITSVPAAAPTQTIASGMVGFSARKSSSGEVTSIYAGDLQGNLWKLDMSSYSPTQPATLDRFSYYKTTANTALPMYIAQDASGHRQPISMEPALVFGGRRTIIVSFGTGKFLESADNTGPYNVQSVYSVLDDNTRTIDSTSPTAAISGRARLIAGSVSGAGVIDVPQFVWGRAMTDASASRSGWYFDYYDSATVVASGSTPARPGTGERQVSNFGVLGDNLIFGSVIPAPNSCSNGSGNLYIVNVRSGDGQSVVSPVGIPGEPLIIQVGASNLDISDTSGRRRETIRYQIGLSGSGGVSLPGNIGGLAFNRSETWWPGRLSWREVTNYQELRNTP